MDVRSATTATWTPSRAASRWRSRPTRLEPALRRADGRSDHLEPYWRRFVAAAVDQGTAFMTQGGEAVALGATGRRRAATGRRRRAGRTSRTDLDADAVRAMHTLYDRFEASRGPLGPHYTEPSRDAPRPSRPRRRPGLLAANPRWDEQRRHGDDERRGSGRSPGRRRTGSRRLGRARRRRAGLERPDPLVVHALGVDDLATGVGDPAQAMVVHAHRRERRVRTRPTTR